MQKWEYKVVGLSLKNDDWVVQFINGIEVLEKKENKFKFLYPKDEQGKIVIADDMYGFMDLLGEEGWELVNVTFTTQTLQTEGTTFYQNTTNYQKWYRLFFKRPKES
jgi:hypothetical protein